MECKCEYYHYVNGRLVCVQCGKPSDRPILAHEVVEDKMEKPVEDKVERVVETKAEPRPGVKGHIADPETRDIARKSSKRRKGK